MKTIGEVGIQHNPLASKADLQEALRQLLVPLKPYYTTGRAGIKLGETGASYASSVAEMEGFSRVLWGLVPALAGMKGTESPAWIRAHWEICLEGIRNGTNPVHEEYWGSINDYDQRLVEMTVFGFALAALSDEIWERLNQSEQANLYAWLNQINSHPCHDCNWLFFQVLVNVGFRKAGLSYDANQMERNLDRMNAFYLSDGWYCDGEGGHSDYYGPFAIHYYGLLYAKLMEEEDPVRAALFKQRAAEFAGQFLYWFTPEGEALPYGRSLTYRFAQSAFWSALAYAEVDVLSPGVIKGMVLRNLRWWFKQPIIDARGILTIGYRYPNLVMSETYNSPGSPYWSLKTFLPLALAANHPFWEAEEKPMPELSSMTVQKPAHLVLCRETHIGHLTAFNSGHHGSNEHTHTSAKYEKFAYSTAFGFSVPRAEWGLSQGAFDSMLALSEGDNLYRVRRSSEETHIQDNVLYSRWRPWRDVEVQTWIVAGVPWHIRIHLIHTARTLDVAEGGFAFGLDSELMPFKDDKLVGACSGLGCAAVQNLRGFDACELVYPNANTNLLQPRTVIPTLTGRLTPGLHCLVSGVYGSPGADQDSQAIAINPAAELQVDLNKDQIRIVTASGDVITIAIGA